MFTPDKKSWKDWSYRQKEKIDNMIIYFTNLCPNKTCDLQKLMWFMYTCDMKLYRETGLSMTGLQWLAYKNGPFNIALFEYINEMGKEQW